MVNKVILIGRLGKDPEVRYTPDGMMVTSFSLATDESWKDKSGEKQQKTEWHNIVTFGKLAEICGNYLTKGKLVFIEGKIQTQSWEKDGQKHYKTQIVAKDMRMLDGKKDSSGQDDRHRQTAEPDGMGPDPSEEDVPF